MNTENNNQESKSNEPYTLLGWLGFLKKLNRSQFMKTLNVVVWFAIKRWLNTYLDRKGLYGG